MEGLPWAVCCAYYAIGWDIILRTQCAMVDNRRHLPKETVCASLGSITERV